MDYATTAARILTRRHEAEVIERIQPGQLGCCSCGHIAPKGEFRYGRGRSFGEHPEHRYCPWCGRSIEWFGYVSGDQLAALIRADERATKSAAELQVIGGA